MRRNRRDSSLIPASSLVAPLRAAEAPFSAQAIDAVGRRLAEFAATLPVGERRALRRLLVDATGCTSLAALAAEPPEAILDEDERAVFDALIASPPPEAAGLRETLVVVMKATRLCNLRCTYCHFWSEGTNQVMPFDVLARTIAGALADPSVRVADFVWHGGEVTVLPIEYYRKAIWLQRKLARPGQKIVNTLQTNGVLFDDEWIDFCRDFNVGVGVSLDGPPELHDRRRIDAAGQPTSDRVRAAFARLRDAHVPHGALMVVDEHVVAYGARRLIEWFVEAGIDHVGLLNVIPSNDGQPNGDYLPWSRFVEFERELFAEWWPRHANHVVFRELEDLLAKVRGNAGETCFFAGDCMGGFLTVEPNGDVSACDKYVGDRTYHFGNVHDAWLGELAGASTPIVAARRAQTAREVGETASCRWASVCQGACPHDRYLRVRLGPAQGEQCCGLAPLLDDMAVAAEWSART